MSTKEAEVHTFESLSVGDAVTRNHVTHADSVNAFATISGDHNALHMDDDYAGTTTFGKRVVHGMLLGAYVSELVGMYIPGKYALLLKETLEFKSPVFIDDEITITGTILSKSEATHIIEIGISIMRDTKSVAVGTVHAQVLAQ